MIAMARQSVDLDKLYDQWSRGQLPAHLKAALDSMPPEPGTGLVWWKWVEESRKIKEAGGQRTDLPVADELDPPSPGSSLAPARPAPTPATTTNSDASAASCMWLTELQCRINAEEDSVFSSFAPKAEPAREPFADEETGTSSATVGGSQTAARKSSSMFYQLYVCVPPPDEDDEEWNGVFQATWDGLDLDASRNLGVYGVTVDRN